MKWATSCQVWLEQMFVPDKKVDLWGGVKISLCDPLVSQLKVLPQVLGFLLNLLLMKSFFLLAIRFMLEILLPLYMFALEIQKSIIKVRILVTKRWNEGALRHLYVNKSYMIWICIVFKIKLSLGMLRIYGKMRYVEEINGWFEKSIIFFNAFVCYSQFNRMCSWMSDAYLIKKLWA